MHFILNAFNFDLAWLLLCFTNLTIALRYFANWEDFATVEMGATEKQKEPRAKATRSKKLKQQDVEEPTQTKSPCTVSPSPSSHFHAFSMRFFRLSLPYVVILIVTPLDQEQRTWRIDPKSEWTTDESDAEPWPDCSTGVSISAKWICYNRLTPVKLDSRSFSSNLKWIDWHQCEEWSGCLNSMHIFVTELHSEQRGYVLANGLCDS